MNIRVLHTEWSLGYGGQEIRILNEAKALKSQGVFIAIACRKASEIGKKAKAMGIDVHYLPFRGNTDFVTLFGLMRLILKLNIHIVNTHSGKDTWVGGLAAKLTRRKFIRTRHLSNPIKKHRFNFINELADYVFTTGTQVQSAMILDNRIKPACIASVPTGIDDTYFNPADYDKRQCQKQFKLSSDAIWIGTVGVLRSFKRQDNFIRVAKALIEKNPDKPLQFVIAGEGPQRANLEQLIAELQLEQRVHLIGHIETVPAFLAAIDYFLFTSDCNEGVPQSVIQALMMEKAVVATTAGSTSDLQYQAHFKLVEPSLQTLISAMQALLDGDKPMPNRAWLIQHFSMGAMTETILKVYRELLCPPS